MAGRIGINTIQGQKKNMSYIKELIYAYSPISRAEIAEKLSLTPATITNNVAILLELGLIRERVMESNESNPVGRRPIMLEYIPEAKYSIGIEISDRGLYLVICNICGEVVYKVKSKCNSENYNEMLEDVTKCVDGALSISNIPRNKLLGLGIGVPKFIGFSTDWEYEKLEKDLHEKLGLSVCVGNNASVRALNEGLFDRGIPDSFAYLFVSRGIACPVMFKKHIISREITGAGEIGHMVVDINGPRCERCGDHGCLDTYAGESAIIKKCSAAIRNGEKKLVPGTTLTKGTLTIEEIIDASNKDDQIVDEILDTSIKYLAVGVCNIIKFITPEMVVIDAYIMSLSKWKKRFLEYIEQHISENKWNKVAFVFKDFDEYSGSKGSAVYAIKKFLIDSE